VDETGCAYAVKIALASSDAPRLAREAACLAEARCPSLVRLFGGGRLPVAPPWDDALPPGQAFLLLEAAEGEPLCGWAPAERATGRGATAGVATGGDRLRFDLLLRDIADALSELHAVGVSHGDVKPANVLLRAGPAGQLRATLIDLGLQADAAAVEVAGGTPRYLPPEVLGGGGGAAQGDGRARDLYALALTCAELLVPSLREAPDLRAAVLRTPLPEPFEGLLRPLLADGPALRPSLRWVLARGRVLFGWDEDWARARRLGAVRREYLRVRRDGLRRAAAAPEAEVLVEGAPGQWLREALGAWRAAGILDGPHSGIAPSSEAVVGIADSTPHQQRRWVVGVVGPSAAGWSWPACSDAGLATRLGELAEQSPLEGITRAQLTGVVGDLPRATLPDEPALLALKLAELPVDVRVLERIEALRELPGELGLAAARHFRLRGEYARARLLMARLQTPAARIEAALCARRLGEKATAERELAELRELPPELESVMAAQRARALLDAGRLEEAQTLCEGQVVTVPLLETRALIALASGDLPGARASLEEGRDLARDAEQLARLAAVAGLLAHREARPAAALDEFRRAASHAERAGAVLEEATYLTGVAAAAADRGELGVALHAAERATLLFEATGRPGEAARAALTRAAVYSLVGAEAELVEAGNDALERARQMADRPCEAYVHLALSDGLRSVPRAADEHARAAARLLAGAGRDEQLRAGARLLEHGLSVDVVELDHLAHHEAVSAEAQLEWWGARARSALERGALERGALEREGTPAVEGVLHGLLGLVSRRELGVARGPAFVHGARLALSLARSDDARRLMAGARGAAKDLLAGTPEELRRYALGLDWIALAETPEGSALVPEQLEEVEALVRSLGTRERLKPLLEQVLDALLLWTGVERGLLLLRAPARSAAGDETDGAERLVVRAARNLARDDLRGDQLELSQSLARRALDKGAPVVAVDATGELSDMHRSVHALKLRSVLAVPLIARGETQGVVYLDDRVRRGAFGTAELAWVKLVATLAAVAIADARDQLRLRRAARRARRAEARMAENLARREVQLELAERELSRSREMRGDYSGIVGRSEPMLSLLKTVDRVAASEVPVLVLGESGSGKELIARALHHNGPRKDRPFVAENCAAIPEPLLESTLFGHVRGAFTGAARQRAGLFEVAHGGTLFLDEVAEMPLAMQTKLLRVLQEGEIRPVGAERSRKVDVRVVAATHRELRDRVASGLFREDLFYRLHVVPLRIPPLRERAGDIPLLVQRFAEVHGQGATLEFAPEALDALLRFSWPGNVRQLENEVRRLLVLTDGVVRLRHLSPEIQAQADAPRAPDTLHLRTRVDALERELVERALERTEGNQTRAAELLGLSRFGLQKMMRRLEVGADPSSRRGRTGRGSPSGLQESR
jgi:transcriptional regulator with GAF, ATPase, and Fis domain